MAIRELNDVTADQVGDLEDDELIYLQQRSRFADEVAAELNRRGIDVSVNSDPVFQVANTPNYGDANTKGAPPSAARTREEGEEDDSYLDDMKVEQKNLTKPQLVGAGLEVEDDDEDEADFEIPEDDDYESWKNDQLRAELQRRANEGGYEVNLDGKKSELAQRLRDQDKVT